MIPPIVSVILQKKICTSSKCPHQAVFQDLKKIIAYIALQLSGPVYFSEYWLREVWKYRIWKSLEYFDGVLLQTYCKNDGFQTLTTRSTEHSSTVNMAKSRSCWCCEVELWNTGKSIFFFASDAIVCLHSGSWKLVLRRQFERGSHPPCWHPSIEN